MSKNETFKKLMRLKLEMELLYSIGRDNGEDIDNLKKKLEVEYKNKMWRII